MRQQPVFYASFAVATALVILSAVVAPRFLAFGPGIIALVFSALLVMQDREGWRWVRAAFVLVPPVLALAAASALWALAPDEVLERAGKLALVMLPGMLLLALVASLRIEKARPYLWIIAAGVMGASLLISIDLVFNSPFYRLVRGLDGEVRVPGSVYNRAAVAIVLCLFPAAAMLRRQIGDRQAFGILVLFLLPMLFLIESQSAQLALFAGTVFAALFPYGRRWAWQALSAGLAVYVLAMPFLAPWAFEYLAPAIAPMPVLGEGGGYAGPRMEIWDYVSRYALERPLLGHGIEASRVITDFDSAQIYQQGTSILHPHNFALQLWLELGLAGALCGATFLAFLLHVMRTTLRPDQARIALPTLIAALSVASTGYGMWQGWWVGALFLAAALCILATRQQPPPQEGTLQG